MASPINITPSLKGESSAYFNKQLKEQEQSKITIAEKERMLQMMNQVLKKYTEKK
jgi:cytochrome c553